VLRVALAASHERLRKTAPQVPAVCADLLKTVPRLRATHRDEPIITVSELLGEQREILASVLAPICR
jgi:hypothetical protein